MNRHEIGMKGQQAAKRFLLDKGYMVLAENYRMRTSEIDIIARDGMYIVFAEVKYRKGDSHGLPRESVDRRKQKRIIEAALHYIYISELNDADFRFDVVEVLEAEGKMRINHISNAFDASS